MALNRSGEGEETTHDQKEGRYDTYHRFHRPTAAFD